MWLIIYKTYNKLYLIPHPAGYEPAGVRFKEQRPWEGDAETPKVQRAPTYRISPPVRVNQNSNQTESSDPPYRWSTRLIRKLVVGAQVAPSGK
jgi:hypothetical protein